MFKVNDDLSIYATRGDIVFFSVSAEENGEQHTFQAGDLVRFKAFSKKDCENVILQKDFPVTEATDMVDIFLTEEDTKIGEVISKPVDYWYEIELNPFDRPQTIIGYDDDGAKIFKLFPEGDDLKEVEVTARNIPFVDDALDMTSTRPVQNQAIASAVVTLNATIKANKVDADAKSRELKSKAAQIESDLAVERARITNLAKLKDGSTTGDAELQDVRVGADGKTYASAGESMRGQLNTLMRGRFALATLLPSSVGEYPSISTTDKTFTMGADTLIISDRLPMGYVSLLESNGNNTVTWGDEITSSAVCFYYDIGANQLVALDYTDRVVESNYILLATLRIGWGKINSTAICTCPIYVDGKLSTEVHSVGGFAALLPPLNGNMGYPKFSTIENTVTFPEDTLIVDPRLPNNYVSLQTKNENNSVYFGDFTTSAICIYYGIAEGKLVAKAYSAQLNTNDYLLLCTVRKASHAYETPMAWACCPVWIDERLSTDAKAVSGGVVTMNDVAHRGYSTEAPENTLAAYRLAKKKGFNCVECDVSFTSDGRAVLLHDSTVDRTSNGTGNIKEMTFDEVRALDFGSWKSAAYEGEQIPTFEEFILLCKRLGLHPYIELKDGTEAQIKGLVNTVKRYGMKGKVTWISFVADFLWWVQSVDPKARLGLVVSTVNLEAINKVRDKMQTGQNEVFIDCAVDNATADAVLLCADEDIPLEVWTVDDKNTILSLYPYISGVTSNNLISSVVIYEVGIKD